MGRVLDYDDTHIDGVLLHTSGPVLALMMALGESRCLSGKDLLVGHVAGFAAGVRAGQGAPSHHDGGWHLTGALGSIAAGAACGSLLGLDEIKIDIGHLTARFGDKITLNQIHPQMDRLGDLSGALTTFGIHEHVQRQPHSRGLLPSDHRCR